MTPYQCINLKCITQSHSLELSQVIGVPHDPLDFSDPTQPATHGYPPFWETPKWPQNGLETIELRRNPPPILAINTPSVSPALSRRNTSAFRMVRDDGKLGEFLRVSWDFIMMSWDYSDFLGVYRIFMDNRIRSQVKFNEICFMGFTLWFSQTSPKN